MSKFEELKKLLDGVRGKGAAKNQRDIITPLKKELGEPTEENYLEWAKTFGNELVQRLSDKGISADKLSHNVRLLVEFLSQLSSEKVFDCKPPLGKLDTSFEEIAGQEHVKRDLLVNYIYPQTFPGLFTSQTKGMLLYGPPGGGKSILARAATSELQDVAFFAPSAGELRGKYEGETEKNIDKVFACAKAAVDDPNSSYKLAVLFMDEFDAIAGSRGDDQSMRRSVNALLQAMDGIIKSPKVSVIAATNYPWDIDDAVLRRLSARVFVDLPDAAARKWLVESVLAENYGNPLQPLKERRKEYAKSPKVVITDVYELMNEYGFGCEPHSKEEKLRWKEGKKIVTSPYVNSIASDKYISGIDVHLGPTEEGKTVIEKIKSGEYVNPEDYKGQDPIFGYSASDIIKMMNIAVQSASFEALNGRFTTLNFGKKKFYVSVPVSSDLEPKLEIDEIPGNERDKVISFSLCVYHIQKAFKEYPTTIRNDSYIRLLNYKYLGRSL